jgi:hypothetical protein
VAPEIISAAKRAVVDLPGMVHAHARARWTGRRLRVEAEAASIPA